MKFLHSDDPIIACSTGSQANAAMAVIRISGFKSLKKFAPFFEKDLSGPIEPRRVYYTKLVLQGQVFDDLCLTYFEGPKSYNGENILELSIHGNTLNIERILNLFVEQGGCRLASPGEFTYRALKNKKLTLSQVEGLDLFLNANSGYALDQGLSLLSGNLQEIYQELFDLFLVHKSSLELSIDFAEDVGEEAARENYLKSLKAFSDKFQTLVKRVQPMEHNLIQPEIVLAGLPNSGKSSLFNFFLSEDRAIVSSVAGTTRDYLTETIVVEGVKYKLIDTAGIRESDDVIESEGIRRTRKKLSQSFFSILLVNPFESDESLKEILEEKFDLSYFTHSDLPGFEEAKKLLIQKFPQLGPMGAISLKNLSSDWEKNIKKSINKKYLEVTKDKPILLERHKLLILQTGGLISSYQSLAQSESDVAILSQELNNLGHCISELIGIVSPDQVLNSIFSNFCIGK
jgi:tRNA modification GTPase